MSQVRIYKVLDYYDSPILFIGKDVFGYLYLSVRIDHNEDELEYFAALIPTRIINKFIDKQIDLNALLSGKEWFILKDEEQGNFKAIPWITNIPKEFLP